MIKRYKHPRTPHVPWSPGFSSDDIVAIDNKMFDGKRVIVSEKLDGEATTIYSDGYSHARSVDSKHHASRSWIKQLASQLTGLPETWRICGENLYAYHSIFYADLPSYFFVYGIYDGDVCLDWDSTVEFCSILGLQTVPVLYDGFWDESLIRGLWTGRGFYRTFGSEILYPKFPKDFSPCEAEGYVIRVAESFFL